MRATRGVRRYAGGVIFGDLNKRGGYAEQRTAEPA